MMHVMDAIERMESHLSGVSDLEGFVKNDLVFDATVRQLEIIGEASNNVSKSFQTEHPNVPWKDMIELRNVLIHEYFGVNAKIVV